MIEIKIYTQIDDKKWVYVSPNSSDSSIFKHCYCSMHKHHNCTWNAETRKVLYELLAIHGITEVVEVSVDKSRFSTTGIEIGRKNVMTKE